MTPEERSHAAEVVCEFMEPKPEGHRPGLPVGRSKAGWWIEDLRSAKNGEPEFYWDPKNLDLDALHLVEARLSDEQWVKYRTLIQEMADPADTRWSRILLHADADTKLAALARVIEGNEMKSDKPRLATHPHLARPLRRLDRPSQCFRCDGTGLTCDVCGESQAVHCGCGGKFFPCEDCGGSGK